LARSHNPPGFIHKVSSYSSRATLSCKHLLLDLLKNKVKSSTEGRVP